MMSQEILEDSESDIISREIEKVDRLYKEFQYMKFTNHMK